MHLLIVEQTMSRSENRSVVDQGSTAKVSVSEHAIRGNIADRRSPRHLAPGRIKATHNAAVEGRSRCDQNGNGQDRSTRQ